MNVAAHQQEVMEKQRFEFGKNWQAYLSEFDARRMKRAETSLKEALELDDLGGLGFLDIGCGSGVFSLSAASLGARVTSFDYDPHSVACTRQVKARFAPQREDWEIAEGSALDPGFLASLGTFDIVYSWGVLHHTGKMWEALANAGTRVRPGGTLMIAIYNDQGRYSRGWMAIKQAYNRLPRALRFLVLLPAFLRLWGPRTVADLFTGRPFRTWRKYSQERGMSPWRDVVDWVGGLPFEVAKPEEIIEFFMRRGFRLARLRTCAGGHGCNEFTFRLGP